MRGHSGLVIVAAALAACAASAGGGRASSSAAPADRNPCEVAGTCSIEFVIPDDVAGVLSRAGMNFRVFPGCPRPLGFRENSTRSVPFTSDGNGLSVSTNISMRGAIPLVQSDNSTVVIPRMSGRVATVAVFFRADPGKYVVVDFSNGPDQSAKFGYTYNGRSIVDDPIADARNRTAERHACP